MTQTQQREKGTLSLLEYLLSRSIPLLWHCIGKILPVGMWRTPWAKKRVRSRFKSLGNLQPVAHPETAMQFALDFIVASVGEVSNETLSDLLVSLRLDPFHHWEFSAPSSSTVNFKTVDLVNSEHKTALTIFIKKTRGFDEELDDVIQGDHVALALWRGDPVFLYNRATHVLINCDIWDLKIEKTKISMLEKGRRLTGQAAEMVQWLDQSGEAFDPATPSRAEFRLASYEEPPVVKCCIWRDVYMFLWPLVLMAFLLLLWGTIGVTILAFFRWLFGVLYQGLPS